MTAADEDGTGALDNDAGEAVVASGMTENLERIVGMLDGYNHELDVERSILRFAEGEMNQDPLQCRRVTVDGPTAVTTRP